MGSVFLQPNVEPEGRRWVPIAIGAGIVVLALAAVLVFGRPKETTGPLAIAPYAENLQTGDLKLSAAENFIGGSVSYLDGKIANVGTQAVTGITVEAVFRNSIGESAVPLTPNTTRDFRLTFEHISADWNQGYPELRFTQVTTKK
jgi:hypothetical protein